MLSSADIMQQLDPTLQHAESLRQTALTKIKEAKQKCVRIVMFTLLPTVLLVILGLTLSIFPLTLIAGILGILTCVIWCFIVYNSTTGNSVKEYRYTYKHNIIGSIASTLQSEIKFDPDRGISEQEFNKIDHYQSPDRYHSEDKFEGIIDKTHISFSEVHAEDRRTRTDKDGNTKTYYVTIFKGIVFIADFNKHFNTWITISPDSESDGFFGRIGQKLQALGGNLVKMESPEFEKHFLVRSPDDHQARYVLTPDMQERLLDLRAKMMGKMKISFIDSQVNISVQKSDDWFECDLKVSPLNSGHITRIATQMNHFFQIVQVLNLNNRIWTKK